MKHLLKEGKISLLKPDKESGGALSGEVHLITHGKKKYIVRRAGSIRIAKNYEWVSKQFERYGFFPKFLGRLGKDVFYEYIEGRDLTNNESPKILEQIGRISAYINRVRVDGNPESRFRKQLKELVVGKFKFTVKEKNKRERLKVKKLPKPILSSLEAKRILKLYTYLKNKAKPIMTLDANDLSPNNFRLRDGNVYFVDIEAIRGRIKGFGFAKAYLQLCKTQTKKEAFDKGYSSISSMKFLTPEYFDFIFLNFYIQRINYNFKIFNKKGYKSTLERVLDIIKKYEGKLK